MQFCELKRKALRERKRAQDRSAPEAMLAFADGLLDQALFARAESKKRGRRYGYQRAMTLILHAHDCYRAAYSLFRPHLPSLARELEQAPNVG